MMKIIDIPLNGAAEIQNSVKKDERGWFSRYYCQKELSVINGNLNVVQINSSLTSLPGTIRGLHLQHFPHEEDKIVRCIAGRVFDVILDVRLESDTYGKWHSVILDAEKMNMVYVPKGFAHGFQTLEPNCQILYLHTEFHIPEAEGGYHYNSPELNIPWPIEISEISQRDQSLDVFSLQKE